MSKQKINLCEECFKKEFQDVKVDLGYSFGLHKCDICGAKAPTQQITIVRTCMSCG